MGVIQRPSLAFATDKESLIDPAFALAEMDRSAR
jgi:hypothetical protein